AAAGLLPAAHRTPTAGPLRRLPASGLPPGLSAAVPRLRPAALPRLRPTARLRPAVPGIRPAGLVTPNSTRSSYFWGPWGGEHTPCGPPFFGPVGQWVNRGATPRPRVGLWPTWRAWRCRNARRRNAAWPARCPRAENRHGV